MQIKNITVEIPVPKEITSEYFENYFKENSYDVLRWAIVKMTLKTYVLNLSLIL